MSLHDSVGTEQEQPRIEPLCCSVKQAAQATGVSPWFIWQLVKRGELEAVRIGGRGSKSGRTLILLKSLRAKFGGANGHDSR